MFCQSMKNTSYTAYGREGLGTCSQCLDPAIARTLTPNQGNTRKIWHAVLIRSMPLNLRLKAFNFSAGSGCPCMMIKSNSGSVSSLHKPIFKSCTWKISYVGSSPKRKFHRLQESPFWQPRLPSFFLQKIGAGCGQFSQELSSSRSGQVLDVALIDVDALPFRSSILPEGILERVPLA